jgi:A/G-specific adenine glycosylase
MKRGSSKRLREKVAHDERSAQALHSAADLSRQLLDWYRAVRRDLPWRRTRDPYAIWLSEIMLQQTRVETVVPYYERFLRRFPDVATLAEAPLEQVLTEWSGLGYYRRARMLHAAAKVVAEDHASTFPRSAARLRALPGVGRYTAGAIASIAWGERAPLVDGNVARVLARIYGIEEDPTRGSGNARVWALAEGLVPEQDPGDFNQALMELGATLCIPRAPRCDACPLAAGVCVARARGVEEELPRIAAKATPEAVKLTALVARIGGGVLFARRHARGLFAGLWEPPSVERAKNRDAAQAAFRALLGCAPQTLAKRGRFTHVLTHRRLEVEVLEGALTKKDADRVAVPEDAPYDAVKVVRQGEVAKIPVSALAKRILAFASNGDTKSAR